MAFLRNVGTAFGWFFGLRDTENEDEYDYVDPPENDGFKPRRSRRDSASRRASVSRPASAPPRSSHRSTYMEEEDEELEKEPQYLGRSPTRSPSAAFRDGEELFAYPELPEGSDDNLEKINDILNSMPSQRSKRRAEEYTRSVKRTQVPETPRPRTRPVVPRRTSRRTVKRGPGYFGRLGESSESTIYGTKLDEDLDAKISAIDYRTYGHEEPEDYESSLEEAGARGLFEDVDVAAVDAGGDVIMDDADYLIPPPEKRPKTPKQAYQTKSQVMYQPSVRPHTPKKSVLTQPLFRPTTTSHVKTVTTTKSKPREKTIWDTKPEERLRAILAKHMGEAALEKILIETKDPVYTVRDMEIRDMMWQLMDQAERFADKYFNFTLDARHNPGTNRGIYLNMYGTMDKSTRLIIGCVASGGPQGAYGWDDLFWNRQKRRALICAIIGNVLVEQVFKHPCFGGTQGMIDNILDAQKKQRDEDGFARKLFNAKMLHSVLYPKNDRLQTPPNFTVHTEIIGRALYKHLSTISVALSPLSHKNNKDAMYSAIISLVAQAGLLAVNMVADPYTIYYFVPVLKEDKFDTKRHECFNTAAMRASHPREATTKWAPDTTEEEKDRAQADEALNQILIWDGLTAYRRGGWESAASDPQWDDDSQAFRGREFEAEGAQNVGIRSRVLTHGWVYCRWGRPRRWTRDGQKADVAEEHGAQWKAHGFLEFRQASGKAPTFESEEEVGLYV